MSLCSGEDFKQGWVGDMLPFLRKNILEKVNLPCSSAEKVLRESQLTIYFESLAFQMLVLHDQGTSDRTCLLLKSKPLCGNRIRGLSKVATEPKWPKWPEIWKCRSQAKSLRIFPSVTAPCSMLAQISPHIAWSLIVSMGSVGRVPVLCRHLRRASGEKSRVRRTLGLCFLVGFHSVYLLKRVCC
jgi:hypothetical protein